MKSRRKENRSVREGNTLAYLEDITVRDRLRPLNEDRVLSLMESIKRLGLQTPISVRWIRDENDDDDLLLVAGHHRLEACRRLGWTSVQAFKFEDELEARLWEISENLHRADLTLDERDEHIREWVRLTSQRVSPGDTLNSQPHDLKHSKVAHDLGLGRTTVIEAVQLGDLTDDAKAAAAEAKLTRKEKLAVAKAPPIAQAAKTAEFKEHKAKLASVLRDAKKAMSAQEGPPGTSPPAPNHPQDDEAAIWLLNHLGEGQIPELLLQLDASGHSKLATAIRYLLSDPDQVQAPGRVVH